MNMERGNKRSPFLLTYSEPGDIDHALGPPDFSLSWTFDRGLYHFFFVSFLFLSNDWRFPVYF